MFVWSLPIMLEQPQLSCKEEHCSCQSDYIMSTEVSGNFAYEMELVCSKEYLISLIQYIFVGGCICGSIAFSLLPACWGRKPILVYSTFIFEAGLVTSAACSSPEVLAGVCFVLGACSVTMCFAALCLIVEAVTADYRNQYTFTAISGASLGGGMISGLSLVLPYWRYQLGVISIIGLATCLLVLLHEESPRYFATSGKYTKAREVLQKIAKANGRGDFNETLQGEPVLCYYYEKTNIADTSR